MTDQEKSDAPLTARGLAGSLREAAAALMPAQARNLAGIPYAVEAPPIVPILEAIADALATTENRRNAKDTEV